MINKNRVIKTFCDLVAIDSVTGEEEIFAKEMVNRLKPLVDFITLDDYGNVYARLEGQGKPLFFAAHMDTVEPGRGIKPRVKQGEIVSDGRTILGADNKAAIAAILETLEVLQKAKVKKCPLEIVLTRSEEIGNLGAVNFDYSLLKAQKGFCFDSSNPVGTIITSSPFYERFDLQLIGREAHASRPEEAINVLSVLQRLLSKGKLGRLDKNTLLNIGIVEGGKVRNTILGQVVLKGEIRSMREENLLFHKGKILNILDTETRWLEARYEAEFVRENPGYVLQDDQLKEAEEVIRRCGLNVNKVISWGVSDANIFNEKGLTCINLGDGSEFSHTVSERIKVSSLQSLVKLMLGLIEDN